MKNSSPLLTPTAYFPPAHWVVAAARGNGWYLEAHENYQKGGWRNRCRIAGPNGTQTLSVPLEKGKHRQTPIQEVRISYRRDWWREHEQSLRTAYGRAPFFEYYAEDIFAVGRQRPETLWELNRQLLEVVLSQLGTNYPTLTASFIRPADSVFLRPEELPPLPPYQQVFTDRHGYLPGLSVLDILFCRGPVALN